MKTLQHGVLDDAGLHFERAGRWQCVPVSVVQHAGELLQLAYDQQLARIWITPGSSCSSALVAGDEAINRFITGARVRHWHLWVPDDRDFFSGWQEGRPVVQVAIPERSQRWTAFQGCRDATTLYAAIKYLQEALNTPIEWGPGHVGLEVIKRVNATPRRALYLRRCESDVGIFMRYARTYHHTDLLWSRPLTKEERCCGWLHRYDKNNAYVGAASSVNLGAGEYQYQAYPRFDAKAPGLWHIILDGQSQFNGCDLPHPTGARKDSWQHTATVQLACDLGYQVTILEAVYFQEYHQTLRPWYELISQARQRLRTPGAFKHSQAQGVAYEALKNIYTSSLGKLAEQARAEKGDPLYRPDWWFGIVALSRARMFMKMAELARVGYRPVAVHTDALYFVSREADPVRAVPGLVTEEQGIGKFKHVDSFRLADVDLEALPRLSLLDN